MGRKVVCKLCKTTGDSDLYFKVTDDNGKNKYYCSQQEYDNYQNEKIKRRSLLEYIALEVLEYDEDQIVPPVLVKRIQDWNKYYDFEVIHQCFREQKEDIQYWIKVKNFSSEYGMASYISKIIESKLNDVHRVWKYKKEQITRQENTTVNIEIMNEIEPQKVKKKDDGILGFLDEEDI